MRKIALTSLIAILILSVVLPISASITTNATVDDSLFISYSFENLDPILYDQVKADAQFNITTIPETIVKSMQQKDQSLVSWWLGPQIDIYDDANRAIHISFFLGGSDIISFIVNGTTMKRAYQVKTEWRKFQVNLTSDFSIDFAKNLAEPLAQWPKADATTFFYESMHTGTLDISFYLVLPSSASSIQVQGDTVFYDMPPRFEDQLLNSPFLILGVLAVALVMVLIYRKAR